MLKSLRTQKRSKIEAALIAIEQYISTAGSGRKLSASAAKAFEELRSSANVKAGNWSPEARDKLYRAFNRLVLDVVLPPAKFREIDDRMQAETWRTLKAELREAMKLLRVPEPGRIVVDEGEIQSVELAKKKEKRASSGTKSEGRASHRNQKKKPISVKGIKGFTTSPTPARRPKKVKKESKAQKEPLPFDLTDTVEWWISRPDN